MPNQFNAQHGQREEKLRSGTGPLIYPALQLIEGQPRSVHGELVGPRGMTLPNVRGEPESRSLADY